uniref:collagen alpha-1(XII) chain-like n=1 Tax=Semicossyphus pulcher TaxID=241346 RepID=UPI0037E7DC2E
MAPTIAPIAQGFRTASEDVLQCPSLQAQGQAECSLGIDFKADVVLLVDGSYSIGLANFAKVRAFLEVLVNSFDIDPSKVQISLVQYSRDPHTEFYLNTHHDLNALVKAVRTFPYRGGSTNTGRALVHVREKIFQAFRGARPTVPRVTILITDGRSSDEIKDPATKLRNSDVEIFAVGVKDAVQTELEAIASTPAETHVYTVEDFGAFDRISKELTQSISLRIEQELCKRQCFLGIDVQADVVLLVDGSSSIGRVNFANVKAFLEVLVNSFDIDPSKVQISLIQYSRDPHTEFYLNTHHDLNALVKAVRTFPQRGGDTNTGRALAYVREEIFQVVRGARPNVPRVLILITDGESSDHFQDPATKLRNSGVEIFAVGVKNAVRTELEAIANTPAETHVYTMEDFDALKRISKELTQSIGLRIEQELCKRCK